MMTVESYRGVTSLLVEFILTSLLICNCRMVNPSEGAEFEISSGQRQLFLDGFGIQEISGLRRTLHQPEKRGAVIRPALPHELSIQTRCAPALDREQRIYKLWTLVSGAVYPTGGFAYSESKDGIHWTRPVLHQSVVYGLEENNYLAVGTNILNAVYDPDEPDPSRRYKGLITGNDRAPSVSPDGIHWQRLEVSAIPSWDESNMSYDGETRTFILTVKLGAPTAVPFSSPPAGTSSTGPIPSSSSTPTRRTRHWGNRTSSAGSQTTSCSDRPTTFPPRITLMSTTWGFSGTRVFTSACLQCSTRQVELMERGKGLMTGAFLRSFSRSIAGTGTRADSITCNWLAAAI